MFIYDDHGLTTVNTSKIRVLYIDRIESATAHTAEEHDKYDVFKLKANVGKITVILSEVTGKHNVPVLTEKMHQITDSKH